MAVSSTIQIDHERVAELTQRELAQLNARTEGSAAMYERASRSLSGGVASSYQLRDPWPIYLVSGEGPSVTDVDGNRYWDFHNGFGSMVQGHANPEIVEAVRVRAPLGTHFAAVTEDTVAVAEDLAARFGLERWRFVNSGSEATMDAIRIARALTGRDTIVKIFGSYHGHHDARDGLDRGPLRRDRRPRRPRLAPLRRRHPEGRQRPDDRGSVQRRRRRWSGASSGCSREGRPPACVIMEAAMMNLGVVLPEPGYLEAVRELTERHGVVLIFDEVKTGLAIAAGGATERFGVKPDMVTLAKTLGGGLPSGAIGGTEQAMSVVEDGSVYQVGTYNGNPLTMAAARASLEQVLTPAAYKHLDALNDRIVGGCQEVIERHRLPGYAVGIGSKGCVTFSPQKIVDYETFKANQDVAVTELAWLWNMNRGIYMTPGREEEWTLSVTHTDEAIDDYVRVFAEMAAALTE